MADHTANSDDELDQDSEPTMTAPPEGRPDGAVAQSADADGEGTHAQDADDQTGAEDPSS
jgi:hypothetical protein